MAASLTIIDYAGAPITDLKNALNAKNLITEIKYEDADCLIFTTPLLPDNKVLKVKLSTNTYTMYYGDAWMSAETITNPVQFSTKYSSASFTSLYCIADTDWFLMVCEGTYYCYGYVGALNNGDAIAAGFGSSSNASYIAGNYAYNVTKNLAMLTIFISTNHKFTNDAGQLMKMPLMWYDPVDKKLIMNGDEPAKTLGLWLSSWLGGEKNSDLGDNYYLSGSSGYTRFGSQTMKCFETGLLVEFEP